MENTGYFKEWIKDSVWGVRVSLFILLLCALLQFGVFLLTQNLVISGLGAQPEEISFALEMAYVGILTTVPVQFILLRFFQTRSYLLVGNLTGIALNLITIQTHNIVMFCILRYFTGMFMTIMSGAVLILIFSRLKTEHMQAVGLSVFFGTVLSNGVFSGLLSGAINTTFDWTAIYYLVVVLQLFAVATALAILNPDDGQLKLPGLTIDWLGLVLSVIAMTGFTYVMIYGPRLYWFEDDKIRLAAGLTALFFLAFISRLLTADNPLLDLSVLKNKNFLISLGLIACYYGLKDSLVLIYSYSSLILQWDTTEIASLGLLNVGGLAVSMTIAATIMKRKALPHRVLIFTGFLLLMAFNLNMSEIISPGLSFTDLAFPVFIVGCASGLIFVPAVIFSLRSIPATAIVTGITLGAYTRLITTINSLAGLYTLQLKNNEHFKESFAPYVAEDVLPYVERGIRLEDQFRQQGLTQDQAGSLTSFANIKNLAVQNQVLTDMMIFRLYVLIILCILLLILFLPSVIKTMLYLKNRNKQTVLRSKN